MATAGNIEKVATANDAPGDYSAQGAVGHTGSKSKTTSEYQQERGVAWDIIDEALLAFDEFMLDDDYDYQRALFSIMSRMRARRDLYQAPANS